MNKQVKEILPVLLVLILGLMVLGLGLADGDPKAAALGLIASVAMLLILDEIEKENR